MMTDLQISWDNSAGRGDICVVDADLQADDTLETAIILSLFTDARVREEEFSGRPYVAPGLVGRRRG